MLWSANPVQSDALQVSKSFQEEVEIRVLLKLNSAKDGATRLPYKIKDSQTIVLEGKTQSGSVSSGQDLKLFRVNEIFDVEAPSERTTSSIIGDSVSQLFNGYNVAVIAYGQDKSGKTRAMFGDSKDEGVIKNVCRQIFSTVGAESEKNVDYFVSISAVGVNCESIRDLLAPPGERKPLKLRADPKKSSISLKELRCVYVTSLSEAASYLDKARSEISSRSSAILKVNVEQRDNLKEVVKASSFQLVDLGSSDKLEKHNNVGISGEDAKKINLSMDTLENVARSLAGTKLNVKSGRPSSGNYFVPYKDSNLTQLLQDAIGGNCKTTLVLTCSTAKEDEEETLNTLNFGANMRLVKNSLQQNKAGVNSKATLDLLVRDFDIKEKNYQSRIELLESEVASLRGVQRWDESANVQREALIENQKLKIQLESLTQLMHNPGVKSTAKANGSRENEEEHSKIMQILMEKCEKVIEIQMKLDNEKSSNKSLTSQLDFKTSKEKALEGMNLKLLEQLQAHEEELKALLASNLSMRHDIEKWSNLANTRYQKIEDLESMMKERYSVRQDNPALRRMSGSSAGSAKSQLDDNAQSGKLSWFFKNPTANGKTTRKVSINSVSSRGSEESLKARISKNGLNLHAVRLNEGGGETDSSRSK